MVLTARIGVVHSARTIIDETFQSPARDWTRVVVSDETVSAESTIEFNLYSKAQKVLQGGDCFKFTLTPEGGWEPDEGIYAPFPASKFPTDAFTTCSFTPAATCTRDSWRSFTIKLSGTVGENLPTDANGYTRLQGQIGPLQNPFSAITVAFSVTQKNRGCPDSGGVVASHGGTAPKAYFKARAISTVSLAFEDEIVDASTHHVGALSQITFTFSAAYALSGFGGKITITTPNYFNSQTIQFDNKHYTDDLDFKCTATGLTLATPDESRLDFNTYEVEYTVDSSVDVYNSQSFVLVCQNWRNPIVPEVISGFKITLLDAKNAQMGVTDEFSIDASSFKPYPITPSTITFEPEADQNTVQREAKYKMSFTTPVALEANSEGCYIKLVFPDDFGFSETTFNTFHASDTLGNRIMPASSFGEDLVLESRDFATRTFVFAGCKHINTAEEGWQATTIDFTMSLVRNPNSTRTSGPIEVIIAKDAAFTKQITSTSSLTLAGTKLAVAALTNIAIDVNDGFPLQQVVQENIQEMEIKFDTVTTIPGTNIKSQYQQAAHIFFPNALQAYSGSGSPTAVWAGQTATVTRDLVGDCQVDGVCYIIQIANPTEIAPGTQTILLKKGLRNPTSVAQIAETGTVRVRTMLKLSTDTDWADIDSNKVESPYRAVKGTIDAGTIDVKPPLTNPDVGITALRTLDQTYATNQLLDFAFTPKHSVPVFGFISVRYPPNTFTFSDTGTATANFIVTQGGTGSSIAVFQNIVTPGENDEACNGNGNEGYGCIIGMIIDDGGMEAGKQYVVRLAGLRNPRVVSTVSDWQVRTFDAGGPNNGYLIDVGTGGSRVIGTAAPIPTFGVDARSTVNGARTSYFITWYSEIALEVGDKITVPFPAEILFSPEPNLPERRIDCVPTIESLRTVQCSFDPTPAVDKQVGAGWEYNSPDLVKGLGRDYAKEPSSYNLLTIELKEVRDATGLYKVRVDFLINPPSRRGSSPFGRVFHTDKNDDLIQQYVVLEKAVLGPDDTEEDRYLVAPVRILTEYGSDFKGAKTPTVQSDDVTQHNEEYKQPTKYELRFRPASVVRTVNYEQATVKIIVNYPKQVTPDIKMEEVPSSQVGAGKDFSRAAEAKTKKWVTEGCQIYEGPTQRTQARCYKSTQADLFEIHDALETSGPGFSGVVTVVLHLFNPENNWDEIGFKIRSYEVLDGTSYAVDKLEGDELRPLLQCRAPCYHCLKIGKLPRPSVFGDNGIYEVDEYAKDYCTACWLDRPQKYLMTLTPFNEDTKTGTSSCNTSCFAGWTSNGHSKFVCERCNVRCAACEDLREKGDKDRCKACSTQYPQFYGPKETCLLRCDTYPEEPAPGQKFQGLYQMAAAACANCSDTCLACSQDQFNCTKCDIKLERALFQRDADGPNGRVRQGTCALQCPISYFMNKDAVIDGDPQWVCEECESPCAACADSADGCLSCDGSDGRSLLWQRKCWRECPKGSAADLATSKCRQCPEYCTRCSTQGQGSCLECEQPFLLEMVNGTGRCVRECSQPGYRPNNAHTLCINKTEFPEIGPIFAILSFFVFWAIVIVKYCFKKETEIIPSLIASIGIIEYFAILFQIWMCAIFLQPRYLGFTLFAFGVLMILNIYNLYYIKTNVASRDARKQEKLSQKKVKKMIEDYKKKEKRRAAYAKAMEKYQRKKKHVAAAGGGKGGYKPIDGDADNIEGNLAEGGAVDPYFLKVAVAHKRVNMRNNRNKVYDLDELSDPGSSISQRELEEMHKEIDEMDRWSMESFSSDDDDDDDDSDSDNQYEGGKKNTGTLVLPSERFLEENGLIKKGSDAKPEYYQEKDIEDRGFNKWVDAYDRTAVAIQWISLFITFKVYRMTYSYFMGRKQFLVLYQKKKFKKHTIVVTLLSQVLVELPLIICGVVGVASLPIGEQLILTCIDTLAISLFLIVLEFVEIARLDKIMKTANTRGHKAKKSAAACEDSDEDGLLTDSDENEDDYPDWRLMIKNVEGNQELFATTATQLKLNELSRLYDPRVARSCVEFNTGTDKEEDPREVRSFPTSPRAYLEFEAPNFGNYGDAFDNCYAESKGPLAKDALKTYSEMGTQAQPSEILTALARKGGDLVTPGLDSDGDYSRRRGTKKKRGRKNKYITQIDAEDDEEADQMSDGSEEDGLDGIKEEDEEDEEERLAKLAKQKADAEAKAKQKKAEDKKAEAARKAKEEEEKRKAEEEARLQAEKEAAEAEKLKKDKSMGSHLNGPGASDNQSELSLMMAQSANLKGFGNKGGQVMEVPPTAASRRFNECDIIGNLDRDEKGNVIVGQGADGKGGKGGAAGGVRASGASGASGGLGGSKGAGGLGASGGAGGKGGAAGKDGGDGSATPQFFDKEGKPTNERGYLIDPKTGDIINNMNGEKMFSAKDLDEKGEVPAPFNVEKHNFNPHLVRGDFDYDRNGKPKIEKDASGAYVDKRGNRVSARGYRIDQAGNVLDNYNRKKLDKAHTTSDGDLPKLFNYNGRRFDVCDIIGQLDKDANGNILPLTDQQGNLVDNKGRRINSKGYLVDEFGNVIDKDGRQIFEAKHLSEDEIPKIFPFTKFNIKNVLGDFEMDPLGNPILDKDAAGNLIDRQGRRVNSKGYLIDDEGNVINKHGKLMFPKKILDSEDDIPKVFRTGLLKSDTASSLSRLMSEIGKNQPSEFDQEEQRIQEEIAQNIRRQKRGNSGNTSVDSMMEDTPANYNFQNQRFEGDMGEGEGEDGEDEEDEYGSQYDQVMGQTGLTQGPGHELAKKRRKKKKKKKKKKQEMEDPSLREHLLAGAYGGVAKPKPKRQGVKYTTDLNAGLRDLATPGEVPMGNFMRDPSKKMIASLSGFANMAGQAPESSRGKRNKTIRSSHGRSEIGSNIGSRVGGGMKRGDTTSKLLDPQQREEQLKQEQMDEINARKAAKLAARKRKLAGKPGKISKDADFEKMFGKDIDEFLEDSEWDIESIDKMSQFSKNSKQTIRSAAQAGKLRGLEKLYLQRIETSMNKNTLQMTGQPGAGMQKGKKKKDGFRGDSSEQDGSLASPAKLPQKAKQAWDTGSRKSRGSQFKGTK